MIHTARIAFSAAVALSLGVGAQTAFARPAAPEAKGSYYCYSGACHRECRENGWASGYCVGGQTGWCECWE